MFQALYLEVPKNLQAPRPSYRVPVASTHELDM
ncbi:MAG: hypothetical protein QOG39_130 [Acidimicrobiaceae bacterium]